MRQIAALLKKNWVFRCALLVIPTAIASILIVVSVEAGGIGIACADPDIACWRKEIDHLLADGEVVDAFLYATEVIYPHNRSAEHIALHAVGAYAYRAFGNMSAALVLLPENAFAEDTYLKYEGYLHGVQQAYFRDGRHGASPGEMIVESCGTYLSPEYASLALADVPREGRQCFHGVGHALMSVLGNDLALVFGICNGIPSPWGRERCAFGALMENAYLYSTVYDPQAPRPYVLGESMAGLCETLSEYQGQCRWFVGRSYLVRTKDFVGAFGACNTVPKPYDRTCRQEVATIGVTSAGADFQVMRERCSEAGLYEEECLIMVGKAVKEGFAGTLAEEGEFCLSLEEPFKTRCSEEVTASQWRAY